MLTNRGQPHLDCIVLLALGPEVRPADGFCLSALSSLDLGRLGMNMQHAWPDLFR